MISSIQNIGGLDIISQETTYIDPIVSDYFIEKIRGATIGSDFERFTQILKKYCPEDMWISTLIQNNYRIYSLLNDTKNTPIKGFIALQVHDDIAKVFRFEVEQLFKGNQLSVEITVRLINALKQDTHISKLQIGEGPKYIQKPEQKAVQLIGRIADIAKNLRINVDTHTHTISR